MTKVAIAGTAGRMGQALIQCAGRLDDIQIAAALERPGHPALGQDAGLCAGSSPLQVLVTDNLDAISAADVLVDFTFHTAAPDNAAAVARQGRAMVLGTTGLTDTEAAAVYRAAEQVPVVWAPNMSLGVNLLWALVKQAAAVLGTAYDAEIVEMHHRYKQDAPSGTALRTGEMIAAGRGQVFADVVDHGRLGITGERVEGRIGMHALRGGDVVGDHTVVFAGDGERIELGHRATSRGALAMGALRAAQWVCEQKPGLYDMKDVLGL
jgi:4-hydroxy-tetrahydrodipicolinate reductase